MSMWKPEKASKKVYIAGPDVFYPDAIERGDYYKMICYHYGLDGLYPFDNEADNAADIFFGNIGLIEEADFIVANANFFRGQCMDDGTAWEIGYAFARGKFVYCYTDNIADLRTKIGETDDWGNNVEDFGQPINLMIAQSGIIVEGGFEDCIKVIAEVCKTNN